MQSTTATAMHDPVFRIVRNFIAQNYYLPDASSLASDASLVEQGILDSTGILELAAFLEEQFGITIADAELLPENLDTLAAIVAFVARKSATRVA